MDNITELYLNALLSQATYIDGLTPDMTKQVFIDKLMEKPEESGITQAQV